MSNQPAANPPRTVFCVKYQKDLPGLDSPPWPGELGQRIYDHSRPAAFEHRKKHPPRLVHDHRRHLADARARQYLARQMEQFLFGGEADKPAGYVPPPAD